MLASTKKTKFNIVNPLTDFIADHNERLVDLSTKDINETKAKQQIHVIKKNKKIQ
jgi:hypothetical protein